MAGNTVADSTERATSAFSFFSPHARPRIFAINPLIMGQKRKHDTGNENSDNASGATPLAPDLHGIFSGLQLLFSPALATDSKSPLRLT